MPPIFNDRLTAFQKLMLIKILREEKMVNQIKLFVEEELGKIFIMSPAFNLEEAFKDTINTSPIIFVLSPGADPIAYLI
jgi:dynein heavy chain